MKKIIVSLLACTMMVLAFAGCTQSFDPMANGSAKKESTKATEATTSTQAQEETQPATEPATEKITYEDNFDSLVKCMKDNGYIKSDDKGKKMAADFIGAEKGYRYSKGDVKIELYAFDTKNLSEDAKKYIGSVEEKGYYTLYGVEIDATMSENGKYMMIYVDSNIKDGKENEASNNRDAAIELFKTFYK